MYKSPVIPSGYGFGIWFNKREKKEFYVTTLTACNLSFVKNINNKYKEVLLTNDMSKFAKSNYPINKRDYNSPLEERYGMFLVRFLNADFSDAISSYKTFFAFYGIELLKEYSKTAKNNYDSINDFSKFFSVIYKEAKDKLIGLQNQIKDCVDFIYNLDNSEFYKDELPNIKFIAYALRNDFYNYTNQTSIYFNTLFVNDTDGLKPNLANPSKVRQSIKEGKLNYRTSNIYHSTFLSNIVFISLEEIAMNTYITIKKCQNCGKYFIPTSKESEIYCDIIYFEKEKSCRIKGAAETFKKNIGEVDAYKEYKKTYQRILMQIQRGKINPYSQKATYFSQWKQQSQLYLKKYKKGKLSEDELNEWMHKSIDKFNKYDDKSI